MTILKTKIQKRAREKTEAMVKIPLSSLRCILRYPKDKKIICEIATDSIKRFNRVETLDEIINEARLDYAFGKYKTFTDAKDLITELHS